MSNKNYLHTLAQRMSELAESRQRWEALYGMENQATALIGLIEEQNGWFDFTNMSVVKQQQIPDGTEVIMYVDSMNTWMSGIVRGFVTTDNESYETHYIVQEEAVLAYEAVTPTLIAPRKIEDYVAGLEAILSVEMPDVTDYIFWKLPLECRLGKVSKVKLDESNDVARVDIYNGVTTDTFLYNVAGEPLFVSDEHLRDEGLYLRNTKEAMAEARSQIFKAFYAPNSQIASTDKFSRVRAMLLAIERRSPPEGALGLSPQQVQTALSYRDRNPTAVTAIPDEKALGFVIQSFGYSNAYTKLRHHRSRFPCAFVAKDSESYMVVDAIPVGNFEAIAYESLINYLDRCLAKATPEQISQAGEGYTENAKDAALVTAVMGLPLCCDAGVVDQLLEVDQGVYRLQLSNKSTTLVNAPLVIHYNSEGLPLNPVLAKLTEFHLRNQTMNREQVAVFIENKLHRMSATVDKTARDIVTALEKAGLLKFDDNGEVVHGG